MTCAHIHTGRLGGLWYIFLGRREFLFVNIGCRLFANLSSTPFFGHEDRRESEGHNKNTFEMSESSLLDSASAMTHSADPDVSIKALVIMYIS